MDDFRSEYAELMGRLQKLGERYIYLSAGVAAASAVS